MSIFGLVWVASWFGSFSSLAEKVLDTPRYLSHAFFSQNSLTRGDSFSQSQSIFQDAFTSVRASSRFRVASSAKKLSPGFNLSIAAIGQPISSTGVWLGAIETLLSNPSYQSTSYSLALSQPANLQPIAFKEAASTHPHDNPLNYLLGVVQNFFWAVPPGIAATDFASSTPAVVVVRSSADSPSSQIDFRTGYWRCATWQESPSQQIATGGFQVWVKGCLVAEVANQSSADNVAGSLTKLLKIPDLDASHLTLAFEREMPVAKLGDRVVFAFDHELASQFDRPAELVAIDWVNNLRVALGQDPLLMADAQVRMHDLHDTGTSISGLASWYGPYFHGRQTATGEIFDQNELTAAHPSLPFGTFLKVTNLLNGKSVVVRVNDRGPYFDNRILDLSNRAARCIGSDDKGVVPIEAEIMLPTTSQQVARL
jgi:rare lipoprotein A